MAVRVWCEWLALSLVLAVGACSGKSGKGGLDDDVSSGAAAASGGASMLPGHVGKPGGPVPAGGSQQGSTGGAVMSGFAGEAVIEGGVGGTAPDNASGAGPEAGGAAEQVAGIVVSAPGTHMVHESYGTVQVQVILTAQPLSSVKVELVSGDPAHAVVYPLALIFTPENWENAQAVLIVGVRDTVADDGNTVTIETLPAVSRDPRYAGLDAANVDVFVIDETDPGIVVGQITGGITSESGTTATFNIVLTSQPTATVTIPLSSSDLTEGAVAQSVTFEPSEWNKPHPVTVTGVDDALHDGSQPYQIITGQAVSDDPSYAGVDPDDVNLTNVDNE